MDNCFSPCPNTRCPNNSSIPAPLQQLEVRWCSFPFSGSPSIPPPTISLEVCELGGVCWTSSSISGSQTSQSQYSCQRDNKRHTYRTSMHNNKNFNITSHPGSPPVFQRAKGNKMRSLFRILFAPHSTSLLPRQIHTPELFTWKSCWHPHLGLSSEHVLTGLEGPYHDYHWQSKLHFLDSNKD